MIFQKVSNRNIHLNGLQSILFLMEITVEDIEGDAHQNFIDYNRSPKTLKVYKLYLYKFLDIIPNDIFTKYLQQEASTDYQIKTVQFVKLSKKNIELTKLIVQAYVRELKAKVEAGEVKPSNIKNRLKPIKALFHANEIDFSWKLIDKGLPKIGKSPDRAYTRDEIQVMITKSNDIVDKVIILLFSSAGFRVEAWDYFTWNDVVFFYNDNGTIKGMAIRVYAGDAEEYWTHGTPEAAKMLLLYKETWKSRFGKYPDKTDPLIVATKVLYPKRLRMGGVRTRVVRLLRSAGIRSIFDDSTKRHEVPADHGFRKYCNTMMRRAKVDFADKEDMQGRDLGMESSYERYIEDDFERWPEYQKAIPFLTIDDAERSLVELARVKEEKNELKLKVTENSKLQDEIKAEREARLASEKEMKQTLAKLREEKLANYK